MNDAESTRDLTVQPLDYQQRPALPWVSRHRKSLILLALLIATAAPIWWYWTPLKHRVLWLYWSHRATAFQMPAQPLDLFAGALTPGTAFPTTRPAVAFVPREYEQLRLYDPRLGLTFVQGQPVAFMGTRRRPDGTPRLVIVTGSGGITGNILQSVYVLVLPLPRWNDPLPPAVSGSPGGLFVYSGPPPTSTVLKSGIADPTDLSHIIFAFEAGPIGGYLSRSPTTWTVSATGMIDAKLQNDDSITFTLRSFTGSDPNIRVSRANMPGDVQSIQKLQSQGPGFFGTNAARGRGAAPSTRARYGETRLR